MGWDREDAPRSGPDTDGEAYLQRILATAPVGIAVVRGRVFEEVNEGLCLLSGFNRDELIGNSVRKLFIDDVEFERVRGELYDDVEDCIRTAESRFRKKDDSILDVLLRVAPLPENEPGGRGYTQVVLDIGDHKRAEKGLETRLDALTRPEDALVPELDLRLDALFDLDEIQKIQDSFAEATGVASIITDVDGKPLTRPSNFTTLCMGVIRGTEKGCANCYRSDAALGRLDRHGPLMSPCLSGGLWDGGAGISVGDRHIANWLIGQVVDESIDEEKIRAYAAEIGADQNEFDAALAEVPRMPKERFAKICDALFLIAQQLSTLAFNNIQQARAIAARHKAVEEKDALYRELKHRVKNGMTLIASLVDLEAGRSDSDEVRASLASTRARIQSLTTLYDLFGGTADPTDIRLDSYLARIVGVVEETFGEAICTIEFKYDFEALSVQARSAAPVGLILMELLTNAIKYAFPANACGTVDIMLSLDPERRTVLTVRDDGIGLPVGFDPEKSTGLGMELIRMLSSQLAGEFEIDGGPGAGFIIRLPVGVGREADESE